MLPPHYRPAPYMPRGYVTPYAPMPTYAPPPPPLPPPPPPPYHQPLPGAGYVQPGYRPPVNDCCGRCAAVCGPRGRRSFNLDFRPSQVLAKSAKTVKAGGKDPNSTLDAEQKDQRCSSKELKEVMSKISYRSPSVAKRLIQRIAEEKFGGYFSVFCSADDFTYVSRGEMYCQTENEGVVCYAFRHH
ncbi:unnamed protein product [Strongylus vulgaris]|uniref:Ground-like domain-containing protein n=1 Tax=Strongylus vulgaris TaxID=40348 RepID=A0A3P7JID8_STRVU|nr:unnamed protein product [Strongylus vulgaris]